MGVVLSVPTPAIGDDAGDRGVHLHRICNLLLHPRKLGEGDLRLRFQHGGDETGILIGQEAFGGEDVEPDRDCERQASDEQGCRLVAQHPFERDPVELDDAIDAPVKGARDGSTLGFGLPLQELRTSSASVSATQ